MLSLLLYDIKTILFEFLLLLIFISLNKDSVFNVFFWTVFLNSKKERKKECERSQLWSMDWCGERPFGHQASHHICVNKFDKF